MKTEQKSNQKVTTFKIYLKQLKNHMLELSKIHRANFFLVKFKSKLKSKILDIDNVSNVKKKILAATIMQKTIFERTRFDDENENFENHFNRENFENHKNDFENDFDDDSNKNDFDYKNHINQKFHENSNNKNNRHDHFHFFD